MLRKSQVALFGLLLVLAALVPSAPALAATDRLPDLGMARLRDLKIENAADGRRLLRFAAIIVNTGAGSFELRGQRANTSSPWTVNQRIYDDQGTFRDVPTTSQLVYGGDGHNHWHVLNLERYELERLDNGSKVGTGVKSGFCFLDGEVFGSLALPIYPSSVVCKGGASGLQTKMGLSIGWGDLYGANLPDQYIDITNLTAGQYRLHATADPNNWYLETNETNNNTWVDIQLTGSGVTIDRYGVSAMPSGPNQLANRLFEEDTNADGRPDKWTSNSKFTRSNEMVQEGSYAGKHYATDDLNHTISQTINDLAPGTTYTFSGYVNIPATTDAYSFRLQMRWRNASNAVISTSTIKNYKDVHTNGAWQEVKVDLVAPPGTVNGVIQMLVTSLNGTIYVDNFVFGPKQAP
jgi:hypothetical protein